MRYKIAYRSTFERDIKSFKNDKTLREAIKKNLSDLLDNPFIGEPLVGQWSGFYKLAFHERPQMRIIYCIYPCCPTEIISKNSCRFEDVDIDDPSSSECSGLVEFLFVRTREDCTHLYKKTKDFINNIKRE